VAGAAEDGVDALVCGQLSSQYPRRAALTQSILLAGGLLSAAGSDGVGSALGGGFSWGRHVELLCWVRGLGVACRMFYMVIVNKRERVGSGLRGERHIHQSPPSRAL
jgi:hypothetical protein